MRRLHARCCTMACEAVLERRAAKPMFGVCVGMQMLLDHSEEPGHARAGLVPVARVRFRPRRPAAAGRQPPQGAADGLEPGAPDRARAPGLARYPRRADNSSISCTASTMCRAADRRYRGAPTTAPLYLAPWPAIIFLRPVPPRKAPRTAGPTGNSCAGTLHASPLPRALRPRTLPAMLLIRPSI